VCRCSSGEACDSDGVNSACSWRVEIARSHSRCSRASSASICGVVDLGADDACLVEMSASQARCSSRDWASCSPPIAINSELPRKASANRRASLGGDAVGLSKNREGEFRCTAISECAQKKSPQPDRALTAQSSCGLWQILVGRRRALLDTHYLLVFQRLSENYRGEGDSPILLRGLRKTWDSPRNSRTVSQWRYLNEMPGQISSKLSSN
jgi:hypothetical protein